MARGIRLFFSLRLIRFPAGGSPSVSDRKKKERVTSKKKKRNSKQIYRRWAAAKGNTINTYKVAVWASRLFPSSGEGGGRRKTDRMGGNEKECEGEEEA